jgi:hypothetical protein
MSEDMDAPRGEDVVMATGSTIAVYIIENNTAVRKQSLSSSRKNP